MTQLNLILSATQSASEENLKKAVARELNLPFSDIVSVRLVRRSVDARQRLIRVHLTVEVQLVGEQSEAPYSVPHYKDVSQSERQVVIVGAGPAGLFAALTLIENGIRPIVLERGKQVSERKKDIALLNRNQGLQAESNYCFGEGGAGTFSDGKLFSRSKKRGDMQRVMEIFHYHGAADSVLYETHAHIGSDHLPRIIENIRHTIITHGGQIHFSQKAAKIGRSKDDIYIITTTGEKFAGEAVILAIGHSAHDTYRMLFDEGISLEAKGFAMGVRVEHEQSLINRLMYHLEGNDEKSSQSIVSCLGNASYSLVSQVGGRGVYSFCMCPGGHIVPAASTLGSCVVNGMSASHRNSPFANSGMVVEIRPEDIPVITGQPALDALIYQESVERLAFEHGKEPNIAPAQRLQDFVLFRAFRLDMGSE